MTSAPMVPSSLQAWTSVEASLQTLAPGWQLRQPRLSSHACDPLHAAEVWNTPLLSQVRKTIPEPVCRHCPCPGWQLPLPSSLDEQPPIPNNTTPQSTGHRNASRRFIVMPSLALNLSSSVS